MRRILIGMLLIGMLSAVKCEAVNSPQPALGFDTDKWVWSPEKKEFIDRLQEKIRRETPAPDVNAQIAKRLKYMEDNWWIPGHTRYENGQAVKRKR